jgi:hypothetical protein
MKLFFKEIDYQCAKYGGEAQDYIRWYTLVYVVFNCRIMFLHS